MNTSRPLIEGLLPEFDSPRECLKTFTEVYPNNTEAHYELGWILEAHGALEEAQKEYAKVMHHSLVRVCRCVVCAFLNRVVPCGFVRSLHDQCPDTHRKVYEVNQACRTLMYACIVIIS
jgi:hypothetical protein